MNGSVVTRFKLYIISFKNPAISNHINTCYKMDILTKPALKNYNDRTRESILLSEIQEWCRLILN